MRGTVVLVCLTLGSQVGAEPELRVARWQQADSAPALSRVWGIGSEVYGVGAGGAFRSTDGGATWTAIGDRSAANGVWGAALDDVWVIRNRTLHHSTDGDGVHWTPRTLPVSFGTKLEGMWGVGRDRYVFGSDRSVGAGVILRSRDGGTSWKREPIDIERVAGVWGSSANDVYAVGSDGAILHSSGDGSWKRVRTGSGSLEGIWGDSAKAIYAVGTGGTILFFDGKTWAPRKSGVSYALSSIVGLANRELYIGSADGSPLRSTDGVTWKPITALVPRGQVWASADHVVVAANEVHYFGEAAPSTPLRNHVPPDLRPMFAQFARQPAVMEILRHAAHRFDPAYPRPHGKPGEPRIRIASISGCSSILDAIKDPPHHGDFEVRLELTCVKRCNAGGLPTVKREMTVRRGTDASRKASMLVEVPSLCAATNPRGAIMQSELLLAYEREVATIRDAALAAATSLEARMEAHARYVLEGGRATWSRDAVATALGLTQTWRGFFWMPDGSAKAPSTPVVPGACDPAVVVELERKGDDLAAGGSYAAALSSYLQANHCTSARPTKAYFAACKARDFVAAKRLFRELGDDHFAQICLKEGFDPRKP